MWSLICLFCCENGGESDGWGGLAVREFVKIFLMMGLFRALMLQSALWSVQAGSMSHRLCMGTDTNTTNGMSMEKLGEEIGPSIGASQICFELSDEGIWLVSRVIAVVMVVSIEVGGCTWLHWWSQRGLERTVRHLSFGYLMLLLAFGLSLVLQLALEHSQVCTKASCSVSILASESLDHGMVQVGSVLWQLPQRILQSIGDAVVIIAGTEYSLGVAGAVTRTGAAATLFALQGLGGLIGAVLVLGGRDSSGEASLSIHLSVASAFSAALLAGHFFGWLWR